MATRIMTISQSRREIRIEDVNQGLSQSLAAQTSIDEFCAATIRRASHPNATTTPRSVPHEPISVNVPMCEELPTLGRQIEELVRIKSRLSAEVSALRSESLVAHRDNARASREYESTARAIAPSDISWQPNLSFEESGQSRFVTHTNELESEEGLFETLVEVHASPVFNLASVSRLEDELASMASVVDVFVRRIDNGVVVIELLLDGDVNEGPRYGKKPEINRNESIQARTFLPGTVEI